MGKPERVLLGSPYTKNDLLGYIVYFLLNSMLQVTLEYNVA